MKNNFIADRITELRMQKGISEYKMNRDLGATLKEVNSDEYIEQQARSELRMIKEGEVLYIINSDGSKTEVDEDGNPVKNENDN